MSRDHIGRTAEERMAVIEDMVVAACDAAAGTLANMHDPHVGPIDGQVFDNVQNVIYKLWQIRWELGLGGGDVKAERPEPEPESEAAE